MKESEDHFEYEVTGWGGCIVAAIVSWLLLASFIGGLIAFCEWVGRQ